MTKASILLDGAVYEGGGALLRTALCLSTLTGQSFHMRSIRTGRDQVGIKAQHMHCIKALKKLCNAQVRGAEIGSTELHFVPGAFEGTKLTTDLGTAGSLTLVMQCLLLPAMLCVDQFRFRLIGGTDVRWSPSYDFFEKLVLPLYGLIGTVQAKATRRGFYPRGAGEIQIKCRSESNLLQMLRADGNLFGLNRPLQFVSQGVLKEIAGMSFASSELQSRKVAERQATGAKHVLSKLNVPVKIRKEYCQSSSIGTGITLWAKFKEGEGMEPLIGSDSLGEKRVSAEDVGRDAAQKLLQSLKSGAALNQWTADHAILFLGLLGGSIKCSEVSNHTLGNIVICEKFLRAKYQREGQTITTGPAR